MSGLVAASTSRITPPKQPVTAPSVMEIPMPIPASRAIWVPVTVKTPSPAASKKKSQPSHLPIRLCSSRANRNPKSADQIVMESVSQLTGVFPIIRSRIVPPPIAVTNARTRMPKISYRLRMAAVAPETAKAKVPMASIVVKRSNGITYNDLLWEFLCPRTIESGMAKGKDQKRTVL